MPSRIFLLGPDQWDDDHRPPLPGPVEALLGRSSTPYQPRDLRRAAALLIAKDSDGRRLGFVMDPSEQRPGEDEADFFRRLEVEHLVDAYFIILPDRAKVLGTVFEGGMLVRDFHFGRSPRIVLFAEDSVIKSDGRGAFEFVSKGRRTRYLRSLATRAEHVVVWRGLERLFASILDLADADP